MPTGESLARQFLYGQRYFEREIRQAPSRLLAARLFRLFAGAAATVEAGGLDSFFTIKVNWSETNQLPPRSVLVGRARRQPRARAHVRQPARRLQRRGRGRAHRPTWRNFRAKALHDETLLSVGHGDGGGGVDAGNDRARSPLARLPRPAARALDARRRLLRSRPRERRGAARCRSGAAKSTSSCIARR